MGFDEKQPARMQSNQALQASAYVGRQVMLVLDASHYVHHPDAAILIDVLEAASLIRVFVYSQSGDLVKRMVLTVDNIGLQPLDWNENLPTGKYRLVAQGEAVLMVSGNVDSVSLGNDGLRLNVAGIGDVALEQVKL